MEPLAGERLAGRDVELRQLTSAVAELVEGRGGRVLVEGEPGIGKSELLAWGLAGVRKAGCQLYRGTADELAQNSPLQVLAAGLGLERAAAGVVGRSGTPVDPSLAGVEQLLAVVEKRCAESPVVLVLDELHFADRFSLLAWSQLSRMVDQLPLLLVASCRTWPGRAEVSQLRRALIGAGCRVIRLGPLPAPVMVELAGRMAGAPVGPRLRQAAERAGGNPFYLRELVHSLLRDGGVQVSGGRAELTVAPQDLALPGALTTTISGRLESLTEQAREILRLAAAAGSSFTMADVARVVHRPVTDLMAAADEALRAEILIEDGPRLAFRHPLIRQALYHAVPPGDRQAVHLRFARSLAEAGQPVERVAAQLLAAGAGTDGWARGWLAGAGRALVRTAPTMAVELLTRIIDTTPPDDPSGESLQAALAGAHLLLGHHADAARLARLVLARTADAGRAAQVSWTLAAALARSGRLDEAETVVTSAVRAAPPGDPWGARLAALHALVCALLGQHQQGRSLAGTAERQAALAGDRVALGYARYAMSMLARAEGDPAGALAQVRRALEAVGDDPDTSDLRIMLVAGKITLESELDRWADAEATAARAHLLAEQSGTPGQAPVRLAIAQHLYQAGSWDDALAEIEVVQQLPEEAQWPGLRGLAALIRLHRDGADAADRRPGAAVARPDLEPDPAGAPERVPERDGVPERERDGVLPVLDAAGMPWAGTSWALLADALSAERAGEPLQALAVLAGGLRPGHERDTDRRLWLPDLVRLALAVQDWDLVAAAVRACREELERRPLPVTRAALDRCEGLLGQDPGTLSAAAGYYRSAGRLLELGQTMEDAAALLAAGGPAQAARAAAAEAFDSYQRLGAAWDIARAERRLLALGIRRDLRGLRRRPTSGWGALTRTELTVARLVASGLSNPDIAAELHLSRRTVQSHVSHILAKLGARSRREIAEIAAASQG